MAAPKLTPQEPGAPLPDADTESTSTPADAVPTLDAAPSPPESETSTDGMASAPVAAPVPIDPNLRAPDVEIQRNEKLAALVVLNPDPQGLRDVSEYDATKLERPILTKQGWLLPTNPGPKAA